LVQGLIYLMDILRLVLAETGLPSARWQQKLLRICLWKEITGMQDFSPLTGFEIVLVLFM
jgi:hypothetical protein